MARPKSARIAAYLDDIAYWRKQGYPWGDLLKAVQQVEPEIKTIETLRQAVLRARRRCESGSLEPDQQRLPPPGQRQNHAQAQAPAYRRGETSRCVVA